MLRSFTIKNFRCFKDLTIEPLERVNLIAGANNVGKTALLEAFFLHLSRNNPESMTHVSLVRGFQLFNLETVDVWGWMFFGKKIDETIELTALRKDNVSASLKARLVEPKVSSLDATVNAKHRGPVGPLTTATGPSELVLEYQDTTGLSAITRSFITTEENNIRKVNYDRAPLPPFPQSIFLSTASHNLINSAMQFSKLEEVGRQDEVLKELQHLEPCLNRLTILVTGDSNTPLIHGDVGRGRLVPLPLMGEGIVRLLSILLGITSAPGGVVLIDEIENGLHYSVMTKIWQAIAEAARHSETQIFATTHSWECIRAAHEAFSQSEPYDFRLHRLDRINDEIHAVNYDQKMLATAIATDLEVR